MYIYNQRKKQTTKDYYMKTYMTTIHTEYHLNTRTYKSLLPSLENFTMSTSSNTVWLYNNIYYLHLNTYHVKRYIRIHFTVILCIGFPCNIRKIFSALLFLSVFLHLSVYIQSV